MPKRIALLLSALGPAALAFSPTAFAVDPAIEKQLEKLDPATRLEQSCDLEAMSRINKADIGYKPDKVIAYTFKDPIPGDDRLEAPGAVFRSKGDWYRLSYSCVTGPQHMDVRELTYKIGDKVSRADWNTYYLYE